MVKGAPMKGVVFDINGSIGHFRRPDTTATQMTYPFITPTATKGMVGAILGKEDFVTKDKCGIQILNPVRTVAQQMSLVGKDGAKAFNRPTTIELLVNPSYRIYYAGKEYTDQLIEYLTAEKTVYSTYLGVAYALTKPVLYKVFEEVFLVDDVGSEQIEVKTVVPTALIKELIVEPDHYYCRAGGYLYEYKGERTFEKSVDFLFEKNGKPISFVPAVNTILDLKFAVFGEDLICLI